MKQFEYPEIILDLFSIVDMLTTSIPPTDKPGGEITTPEDDLFSEPVEP